MESEHDITRTCPVCSRTGLKPDDFYRALSGGYLDGPPPRRRECISCTNAKTKEARKAKVAASSLDRASLLDQLAGAIGNLSTEYLRKLFVLVHSMGPVS